MSEPTPLRNVTLEDKYLLKEGRLYLTGIQALARLPMLQQERDRQAGLNTAGYISGYRGSPLGGLDIALGKAKDLLKQHDIIFQPGVNEELAADALWGTQQLNLYDSAQRDGVFGLWYGKGPGVDRSTDALKHANAAGSSQHGGVLVLAGDDHASKSSTLAHQSEPILIAAGIPVLYPAGVQEFIEFGLHGWAMSRFTGLWVSMKCVTDLVDSSATIDLKTALPEIHLPKDCIWPADGVNLRWPDSPLAQEARMVRYRWPAATAYARSNGLNRVVIDAPQARLGLVSAGKAYLDARQALNDLGLEDDDCRELGIRFYKIGMVWPVDTLGMQQFADGLEEILVIEEKRPLLEQALKDALYHLPEHSRPKILGKTLANTPTSNSAESTSFSLPAHYELSAAMIAEALGNHILRQPLRESLRTRIQARLETIKSKTEQSNSQVVAAERKPWFCSGCPHNRSTVVPEGSRSLAGIGCHYLVVGMNRQTQTFTQMGGEGVPWLGQMHFCSDKHVFANLGDGTYFHSGMLAIRAAVAAKANITYKILYNDAVAMTGGQSLDGVLTVAQMAHQVTAEGATRVVIVSANPNKYASRLGLPASVQVYHRDELDSVQRTLRDVPGTTVLIYEQVCATELRRRRKRGKIQDVNHRAFINQAVCEGCGDCSRASNCLSVEPVETVLGVKRQINQSSCNKDLSCIQGFCPSFVVTQGAKLKKATTTPYPAPENPNLALPEKALNALTRPVRILVTGVGGTGVVTIGALVGMAAHLDGRSVRVMDITGLAQKGGSVTTHIQIADSDEQIQSMRVSAGMADVLIGCDAVVSASKDTLSLVSRSLTQSVINHAATPTSDFVMNRNWAFPQKELEGSIKGAVNDCEFVDASALALKYLGDTLYANPLMLGYAWQKGLIPLSRAALHRAIELNEVAVERNLKAFEMGRTIAVEAQETAAGTAVHSTTSVSDDSIEKTLEGHRQRLVSYQNAAYAARFSQAIAKLQAKEIHLNASSAYELTKVTARNLAKLMSYKDEYEVARLYTNGDFLAQLREQFDGEPGRDYRLEFQLAPPVFAKRNAQGELIKKSYGPWMLTAFKVLANFKFLRGSVLDPFGKTDERRQERKLVEEYLSLLDKFCATLTLKNYSIALNLANVPDQIRGYGHVKEKSILEAARINAELHKAYDSLT